MLDIRPAALAALFIVLGATPAPAQIARPIPPAVVDARLVFASLGEDAVTAADLAIESEQMPARALGIVAGVHVFPIRTGSFALGIGGDWLIARGSKAPVDDEDPLTPPELTIHRRLQGLSGQLSLNFGHRDGWSYLTAGMGRLVFQTYAGDTVPTDPYGKMTINMGGGARWF